MPRSPLAKPTPRFVEKLLAKRADEREAIRVRAAVRKRDGGKCRVCGRQGFETHHVVYRSMGGRDTEDNIITVCADDHRAIHGHALKVYGHDASSVRFEWDPRLKRRTA